MIGVEEFKNQVAARGHACDLHRQHACLVEVERPTIVIDHRPNNLAPRLGRMADVTFRQGTSAIAFGIFMLGRWPTEPTGVRISLTTAKVHIPELVEEDR